MRTFAAGRAPASCALGAQAQDRTASMCAVTVVAAESWNDSGVDIWAGQHLILNAFGTWRDAKYENPQGGCEKGSIRIFNGLRRAPHDHWFALIGWWKSLSHCFTVGSHATIAAPAGGRQYLFANGVRGFYWNNSGQIQVSITPGPGA